MILPNLRRVLAKNKEARSKAKLHLRYYTDDLQTLVEREMLNEVVAIKEAAYAAVAAGQANQAFSVLRYPTKERKPHLFSTLLDLTSAAEREIELLVAGTNSEITELGQSAAGDPFKWLAAQCRLESIKFAVEDCIPDLEVEAFGLETERRRFIELVAFGLGIEALRERISFRPFQIAAHLITPVVHLLYRICSSEEERVEIKRSKECGRKIKLSLAHWRREVMPRITQVCSMEIGFPCEFVEIEHIR
jgi:hypothetical protein